MKILIISDTHRSLKTLKEVLRREEPIDMLIHLGDVERQMADIRQMVDCPIHMIAGNNDFLSGLDDEQVGLQVFICHRYYYIRAFVCSFRNLWAQVPKPLSGFAKRFYFISAGTGFLCFCRSPDSIGNFKYFYG